MKTQKPLQAKAMIFAAGLGTRLYPLTKDRPKALVELNGKPLLGHILDKLERYGIKEAVINVHHFADKVEKYISHDYRGEVKIQLSREEKELLNTGGGIKKAIPLLEGGQSILIHNVDILSSLDFEKMLNAHLKYDAMATLAVRQRETSRKLRFTTQSQLCGWENNKTGEEKWVNGKVNNFRPLAFSGVQLISSQLLPLLESWKEEVFSVIDFYLKVAKTHRIVAYPHDKDYWMDLGTPERLKKAMAFCSSES